ncbi:ras-related protein Rab-13-like isoform X2 [Ruditapes philippinarum]|nr:ras-related protein Rab-13-like isoform X2 [Ruditapes philippinarum]
MSREMCLVASGIQYNTLNNNYRQTNGRRLTMATGAPVYKIILCGEYGVGKSSLFRRFMNDTFTTERGKKSSIGLDQASQSFYVAGEEVKLTLWDTGGMERMSFIGQSYYRGANAALLCYSINNKETFSILSQYILDIVMNAEGAKIFLCGNFADCESEDRVNETDIENFTRECGNVLSGSYQVSCKEGTSVKDMFADMARVLHKENAKKMTLRRDLVIQPGVTEEEEAYHKKKC